ncbi:MAG: NAD(P)H-dependent oxidoreductase subunit E [Pseudobacteriovorax sp.]|nr:NAD(P)H-dependent oxidoreductase subunit E [Pseudobacteriovorax sp.]
MFLYGKGFLLSKIEKTVLDIQQQPIPKQIALVFVGHGSRRSGANRAFEDTVATLRQRLGNLPTSLYMGYLELAQPLAQDLLSDIAQKYTQVLVQPVMLFSAGHVKNDLPLMIEDAKRSSNGCDIRLLPPIGLHPLFIQRYSEILEPRDICESDILIGVGRGSSDLGANSDFARQVFGIGSAAGFTWTIPSSYSLSEPNYKIALERASRLGPKRIFILPYFLYSGVILNKIREFVTELSGKLRWIKFVMLPHIGQTKLIEDVCLDHFQAQADGQEMALPCTTCQYRIPLGKFKEKVGGFESLLWSTRHMKTHKQAAVGEHSHNLFKKHVLVCTNHDCANRGSIGILAKLRRTLKSEKILKDFKITNTSCLGRCGEGPAVAVYPDGIWYRDMTQEDIEDLVHKHLKQDEILRERVDTIL